MRGVKDSLVVMRFRMGRVSDGERWSDLEAITRLDEPVRRKLYRYVVQRGDGVSREEAAIAVGVSRALAAFHLDKLAEAGLLRTTYRRLSGKTGPGAGRPSKVYWRSDRQFKVTLPDRRHEFLSELLAKALASGASSGTGIESGSVSDAAREAGLQVAASAKRGAGAGAGRRKLRETLERLLEEQGFEPDALPDGDIRLRNCPFHPVSRRFPQLVCAANLAVMEGILEGLGVRGVEAVLDPHGDRCCVVLRATS